MKLNDSSSGSHRSAPTASVGIALRELGNIETSKRKLRNLGVVRTDRDPAADFAEWWVATRWGLRLVNNTVQKDYDAEDGNGKKYQIKSRRVDSLTDATSFDFTRQPNCDFLVTVFLSRGTVMPLAAYKIPYDFLRRHITHDFRFRWYRKVRKIADESGFALAVNETVPDTAPEAEVQASQLLKWQSILAQTNNPFLRNFVSENLEAGVRSCTIRRRLRFHRFSFAVQRQAAYVIQTNRFIGDLQHWATALSRPDKLKVLKEDRTIAFYLEKHQDFEAFRQFLFCDAAVVQWGLHRTEENVGLVGSSETESALATSTRLEKDGYSSLPG